jgi:hypothetical protein
MKRFDSSVSDKRRSIFNECLFNEFDIFTGKRSSNKSIGKSIGGGAWRLVRLEPHLNLTRVGLASPKL